MSVSDVCLCKIHCHDAKVLCVVDSIAMWLQMCSECFIMLL